MNIYQQQILDHYHNPRHFQKLDDFTHTFKLQNLSCGDEVEIYLKVDKNKITDASFQGEGCAISIASASLLTDYLIGQTIAAVKSLSVDKVLELLGIQLTTSRLRCAVLPLEAAQKALS